MLLEHPFAETTAIRTQLAAIFVSLELSRSHWLVTSLSPGSGGKMSRRGIEAGDASGLLGLFGELKRKARERSGANHQVIVIQEAGLDGFWLHRVLEREGCESHVVDAASIVIRLGYLMKHISVYNGAVFLIMVWLYDQRAGFEEQIMRNDPQYLEYESRVRFRFVPGVR